MESINQVVISVDFQDRKLNSLGRAEVVVEIAEPNLISARKLIDACQRAVANAVDTLQNNLDNRDNLE